MKFIHASYTSNFFVLRTPLLPLQKWLDWSIGLNSIADDKSLADDREVLRFRLIEVLKQDDTKEALFLATPEMFNLLHFWYDDPNSLHGQRIEYALTRYFSRMTTRPTPFGLFAGCTTGQIGKDTNLTISPLSEIIRHTRLDSEYLFSLIEKLKENKELQNELIYRPNSSLYDAFGRFRYVKETKSDNKHRSYGLVALENTKYLSQVLESAEKGACIHDLASLLVNKNVNYEQAFEYISKLISEQVLVPDLYLAITGIESVKQLIRKLQQHKTTIPIAEILSDVCKDMETLDRKGIGCSPQRYYSIAKKLEKLPVPAEISRLFQVDFIKPNTNTQLGTKIIEEIKTAVNLLQPLAKNPMPEALKRFIEKFKLRYEERTVSLLEALDEEGGIGFDSGTEPNPLIDQRLFAVQNSNENSISEPNNTFLLNKLIEIWQTGATELILTKKDLDHLAAKNTTNLPDAFVVHATLAANGNKALDNGDFQIIWRGTSGPSGAQLLGRFCHSDARLNKYVDSHLKIEESHLPDVIWAEIVHLPAGRMGNILGRPALREYEIVYLGGSGVSIEKQIPVNDLLISVKNQKVHLYSKRLGCRIIPRLSSAHNYWNLGLGTYRFLCLLQNQDVADSLVWDWGTLATASFLPRVRVGKIILSLAKWQVSKDELEKFNGKKNKELFAEIQKWREIRKLPRFVNLVDSDNILPIDLDNILSIESFVNLVKNRGQITLNEFFPASEQLCVTNSEGSFTHEIIVPFVKETLSKPAVTAAKSTLVETKSRSFAPGSKWLYAKLYAGKSAIDQLLIHAIPDLLNELKELKISEQWFFVRYNDPESHLRLRIFGNPVKLIKEAQPLLNSVFQKWFEKGLIWRIQYDTYEREVERYGGIKGIELSEKIFNADSEAVLEIIRMLEPGDAGLDERWRLTCVGMDLFLNDFGLNLREKYELMKRIRDSYADEHSINKSGRILLGEKYRQERQNLAELLEYPKQHSLSPGIEVLKHRSQAIAPIIKKLQIAANKGKVSLEPKELLINYLHMHANRLLRASHRQQELVIYDLLTRHYNSLLAQEINP
jgi:lantibiotic biosynthesis protein